MAYFLTKHIYEDVREWTKCVATNENFKNRPTFKFSNKCRMKVKIRRLEKLHKSLITNAFGIIFNRTYIYIYYIYIYKIK